jgi:hypothetical protein
VDVEIVQQRSPPFVFVKERATEADELVVLDRHSNQLPFRRCSRQPRPPHAEAILFGIVLKKILRQNPAVSDTPTQRMQGSHGDAIRDNGIPKNNQTPSPAFSRHQ